MSSDIIQHACGAGTSSCPRFDLIPANALIRLAFRYEKGLKYGKDNWRKGLTDRDYVLERLAHGINHLIILREKIEGRLPWSEDDDAAAAMWAGAFLCEATEAMKRKCSACGGLGTHVTTEGPCPACKGTGLVNPT